MAAVFEDFPPAPAEGQGDGKFAYEYDSGVVTETTPWIICRAGLENVLFHLKFTSGSAAVDVTLSRIVDIKAGNAIPLEWVKGEVTADADDGTHRVNAFRLRIESGSSRLLANGG